jgi:sodium/glutamate symporter
MNFEIVDNIMNINLDPTLTLALAGILLLVGYSVKKQVNALNKYCIPAPVIGGFIFMFITFIGHKTGAFKFNFENTF